MILLFTSEHCTMCDMVKDMLEEEKGILCDNTTIYEVNVEKHHHIAEVYGVMMVPTLVAGSSVLSGIPCPSELRSFLLQAVIGSHFHDEDEEAESVLSPVGHLQQVDASSKTRNTRKIPEPRPTLAADQRGSLTETATLKESEEHEPPELTLRH